MGGPASICHTTVCVTMYNSVFLMLYSIGGYSRKSSCVFCEDTLVFYTLNTHCVYHCNTLPYTPCTTTVFLEIY